MKAVRTIGMLLFLFGALLVANLVPLEAVVLRIFRPASIDLVACYPENGMVLNTSPKTVWVKWSEPALSSRAIIDGKSYDLKPVAGETNKWEGEIDTLPAGSHDLCFRVWAPLGNSWAEFETEHIIFEIKPGESGGGIGPSESSGGFTLSRQQLFGIVCMALGLFLYIREERK
jgi:hypothetical protein